MTNNKPLLLMVEDNEEVRRLNKKMLEHRGFQIIETGTIDAARQAMKSFPIELILLDIMLPDGSGLDFCQEIRLNSNAPILILSSLREQETVVKGLLIGGDDYLTKPYTIDELHARIVALLRRSSSSKHDIDCFGLLRVDYIARRAYIMDKDILLKPKEFAILEALIRRKGEFISTSQLYSAVWAMEASGDFRTLWVHINSIRKKIDYENSPYFIENNKALGYRFVLNE